MFIFVIIMESEMPNAIVRANATALPKSRRPALSLVSDNPHLPTSAYRRAERDLQDDDLRKMSKTYHDVDALTAELEMLREVAAHYRRSGNLNIASSLRTAFPALERRIAALRGHSFGSAEGRARASWRMQPLAQILHVLSERKGHAHV